MESLSNYASSLVVTIVSITLIDMILPNNKIKKYAMFSATVILAIVIVNPIVMMLNKDIDVAKYLEIEKESFAKNEYTERMEYAKQKQISETYKNALNQDIIERLKDAGYQVKNISLEIDKNTYEPTKMELQIEHFDGDIQKIVIDVSKNYNDNLSDYEISKIKALLNTTYNIDNKNVIINSN